MITNTTEDLKNKIEASEGRRIKLLMINPVAFVALFKKGGKLRAGLKVLTGVPADADLVTITYDHLRAAIVCVVESESYDPVPVGQMPPTQEIEMNVGRK